MKDKLEHYWKAYQTINEWIRFSDTKAGVVISSIGVIITIIYSNADKVYEVVHNSAWLIFLTSLAAVLGIISIFYSFLCLNPMLKNQNDSSILYFGHISNHKTYDTYHKYSLAILDDETLLSQQLAEQIYINSKISWRKFKNVSISIRFFFGNIIVLILILITYFIKL